MGELKMNDALLGENGLLADGSDVALTVERNKSDQELIKLLKTGEEDVIELIFNKYYKSLCLYAESIVKDHFAAEEIVEDLFVTIWSKSKDLTIYTSLKNYLYRSIHNNSLKYLKKRMTQVKAHEKYAAQDQAEFYGDPSNYQFVNLITREIEEKAEQILESLPEKCKEIYMLNRFENLSYPEIAKKLNINLGTVKTQMSRAFQKFRIGLKGMI